MTWKPTDEMIFVYGDAYEVAPEKTAFLDALIAVQPLIAKEAVDDFIAKAGTASMREIIRAEARAEALEEAAKDLVSWAHRADIMKLALGEMSAPERRSVKAALFNRAAAIRSLIPKPAEET